MVQFHSRCQSGLCSSSLRGLKRLNLNDCQRLSFSWWHLASTAALARLLVGSIGGLSRKVNRSWLCFIIRLRIRHVPLCSIGNSSNSIILEIARSFPLPKSSKTLVPSWYPFQYRQALESKRNTKGIPPGPPPWQEIPPPGCGCLSEGAVNNARRKMSQVRLSLLRLGTNWARAADLPQMWHQARNWPGKGRKTNPPDSPGS